MTLNVILTISDEVTWEGWHKTTTTLGDNDTKRYTDNKWWGDMGKVTQDDSKSDSDKKECWWAR